MQKTIQFSVLIICFVLMPILGCNSSSDNGETNTGSTYQCNDSMDNDADGLTDYPADPGCTSATDDDETDTPPADTTAPTVSITQPLNGATVSNTISVSANANDNVGVEGVQFLLDGANLGAEDTTAPYSINWDTAQETDGSYSLSARARDAAGNQNTASAVSVTVDNAQVGNPNTFYVNNICTFNGNGSEPGCAASSGGAGAWSSLANASFCTGMQAGDILELRGGTYRGGAYQTWLPRSSCSGEAGNHITFQNYPGEDVVLDGTVEISGSTWTSRGGGVYECTAGTCGTSGKFPFTIWYDTGSGEQRLNLKQTNRTCDSTLAVGEMRYNGTGNVCVHLADSSNPSNAQYVRMPSQGAAITLQNQGVDHLTLRKNPLGGSFTVNRYRDHGITMTPENADITIDGLEIGWMMDRCINVTSSAFGDQRFRFINNYVHHCGQEGIRWDKDVSPEGLVANNIIHDVQSYPVFDTCFNNCQTGFTDGGTGIRAIAENGTIANNILYNIGGGKGMRSYAINLENHSKNLTVENNYIYDSATGDPSGVITRQHTAIRMTYGGGETESHDGTILRNNRMDNVNVCIGFDGGAVPLPAGETFTIANNTCNNPTLNGMHHEDGGVFTTVHMVNNIFSSTAPMSGYLIDMKSNSTDGFQAPANNTFYAPNESTIVRWKGSNYTAANISSLGAGNIYGDPRLSTSGSPAALKILDATSAAYTIGDNTFCPAMDFEGDSRPQNGTCDAGADEYIP